MANYLLHLPILLSAHSQMELEEWLQELFLFLQALEDEAIYHFDYNESIQDGYLIKEPTKHLIIIFKHKSSIELYYTELSPTMQLQSQDLFTLSITKTID